MRYDDEDIAELMNALKLGKVEVTQFIPIAVEKGDMAKKLEGAAPYNIFLTAITESTPTHQEPLTITMQEIFDESLGEIESSLQINFDIDINWLLAHYHYAGILEKPLLILYGLKTPNLLKVGKLMSQITAVEIKMASECASSHAKIMLLGYTDGSMRVVIGTANLKDLDWHNWTQSLWMSPLLTALPKDAKITDGESDTRFKADLIHYLLDYKVKELDAWIDRIRKSDFSAINVFLIPSVPGEHANWRHIWGCERLGLVLSQHAAPIDDSIPVVCQSSSIGSLGANVGRWVQRDLIRNLSKTTAPVNVYRQRIVPFKMIHPSLRNVMGSHDSMCLPSPYPKEFDNRQPWLKAHLQQWKSDVRHRSQAMPHNKCYARFNDQQQCLYWFLLTSANLSKSAWGVINRSSQLRIANYEAGVLFLPRFVTGEETFPLGTARNGVPAFPMPYDVPLTPYEHDDIPFVDNTNRLLGLLENTANNL
ncbi:hypothetical protein ACLKA7_004018 [Drosophila subpalustris]